MFTTVGAAQCQCGDSVQIEECLVGLVVINCLKAPGARGVAASKSEYFSPVRRGIKGAVIWDILPGLEDTPVGTIEIELRDERSMVITIIGIKVNIYRRGETILQVNNAGLTGIGRTGRRRMRGEFINCSVQVGTLDSSQ